MKESSFVIGVDYGTDSVRSVIIDALSGAEISSAVFYYPRWKAGKYCAPQLNQFRQHPLDYLEGLEDTIRRCLAAAGPEVQSAIKAISIDTTGSTPIAVDSSGTPLSMLPGFEENPNAMFFLWKDHTSVKEARQINEHAAGLPVNYLQFVGGIYSSEWFWAKLLHVLRVDTDVRKSAYSWVEHCDWIPFVLTGGTNVHEMKRSRCAAGHKGLWASEFGGLPPEDFFSGLDPLLAGFRSRLFDNTYTSDQSAGNLSPEWAGKLGLSEQVVVGVGAFDAHMGAVGGQIEPYYLSKVMGTSTCDMLIAPTTDVEGKLVQGICGQVDGSIIPGMLGMEAGQSAFGDTYAWFRDLLAWPIRQLAGDTQSSSNPDSSNTGEELVSRILSELSKAASRLPVTETDELAVDWLNGRRTPDANQELKAAIVGLNLASDAPRVYRALVESTCFGARSIVERFIQNGIPVKGLIGLGGVARKSPYTMQMLADVINMPIRIHRSEQTCAVGAGMFAATAAGIYQRVEDAMEAMGSGFDAEYVPDPAKAAIYTKRYERFQKLGQFIESQSSF